MNEITLKKADMKIGIIGSGNIGSATARLFANAGHQVAISNSHGPQSLTSLYLHLVHSRFFNTAWLNMSA